MSSASRSKVEVPESVQRLVQEAADGQAANVQQVAFDGDRASMVRPVHWPEDAILAPGAYCTARYLITDFLGRGGIAEVYEARDMVEETFVALKVVRTEKERADVLEKVAAEARTLKKIKHRNVLRVFDAGFIAEEHLLYFTMERLEGSTLHDLLYRSPGPRAEPRRPAMPLLQAVKVALGVARGVNALHSQDIIHRDIKPENLFLTAGGDVKVFDLDVAKFNSSCRLRATRRGYTMGTVLYMSPEHLHEGHTDVRSDVYAIGFVLFELVAGHHAFATSAEQVLSHTDVIPWHSARMPPRLANLIEGVPIALDAIVRKCTEKDPARRYQSCEELMVALSKLEVLLHRAEEQARAAGATAAPASAAEAVREPAPEGSAGAPQEASSPWPVREPGVPPVVVGVHGTAASPRLPLATTERTATAVPSEPLALLAEPIFDAPGPAWPPRSPLATDARSERAESTDRAPPERTMDLEVGAARGSRAATTGEGLLASGVAASAATSGVRVVTEPRGAAGAESGRGSDSPRAPATLRAKGPGGTELMVPVRRAQAGTLELELGTGPAAPGPATSPGGAVARKDASTQPLAPSSNAAADKARESSVAVASTTAPLAVGDPNAFHPVAKATPGHRRRSGAPGPASRARRSPLPGYAAVFVAGIAVASLALVWARARGAGSGTAAGPAIAPVTITTATAASPAEPTTAGEVPAPSVTAPSAPSVTVTSAPSVTATSTSSPAPKPRWQPPKPAPKATAVTAAPPPPPACPQKRLPSNPCPKAP